MSSFAEDSELSLLRGGNSTPSQSAPNPRLSPGNNLIASNESNNSRTAASKIGQYQSSGRVPQPVTTQARERMSAERSPLNCSPFNNPPAFVPPPQPEAFDHTSLVNALSRLHNRQIPRPEPFDDLCGYSFDQFLVNFEEYCASSFRGSQTFWISELAGLLSGEMKMAFEALRVPGESYPSLREKLRRWRYDNEDTLEQTTRLKFNEASPHNGESCRLYAGRLEKLYKLAFPKKISHIQTSKTLQRKLLHTVPVELANQFKTAFSLNKTLNNSELTLSEILTLASTYDAQAKLFKRAGNENEIWLTYKPAKDSTASPASYYGNSDW